MAVLIVGKDGQLGRSLQDEFRKAKIKFHAYGREKLDITSTNAINKIFKTHSVSLAINAAAYTAVDNAEAEPKKAFEVNEIGAFNLAKKCSESAIPLVHISTDYVFDGLADTAYLPESTTNPRCVYGKSKFAGEVAVAKNCNIYVIIRTAWLFSEYGNNFLKTMLKLAQAKKVVNVVSDQIGCPTYAGDLAKSIVKLIPKLLAGKLDSHIYHYAGSEICSWYEFAKVIFDEAHKKGFLPRVPKLNAISTEEYITLANRPIYSVLDSSKFCDNFGVQPSDWRYALPKVIESVMINSTKESSDF